MEFIKQNDRPIEVEYVRGEDVGTGLVPDFVPSFVFEGQRHYLDDYIRVHDNPWGPARHWEFPDHIHGYDGFDYGPYVKYVEVVDGGDAVNVYREARCTL